MVQLKLIIVCLFLACCAKSFSQNDRYVSCKNLQENSFDSIALAKVESYEAYNYYDLLHLLVGQCAQERHQKVKETLLALSAFGVNDERINNILKNRGHTLNELIYDDSLFVNQYDESIKEVGHGIEADTIANQMMNSLCL